MLGNQSVTNEKPQDTAGTVKSQGRFEGKYNSNSTALSESKARYEKGMGLYRSGRVSIGSNGFFKVSGFRVDTEKMVCTCPDYKTRKEACKHLFAAMLFVKNRGKQTIELCRQEGGVSGRHEGLEGLMVMVTVVMPTLSLKKSLISPKKPIEAAEVFSLGSQLKKWALGN